MLTDVRQFWDRLRASQILDEAGFAATQYAFENLEVQADPSTELLAQRLIEQKVLSKFQAEVLLTAGTGPFRFGNYTVTDRLRSDPRSGQFLARHRLTGHSVQLDFFGGSDALSLESWKRAKSAADPLIASAHHNLIPVYETVSLPEYRFIVSATPLGQLLSQRVPDKARLESPKAALIIAQLATALHHLHAIGLTHGHLSIDLVWIDRANHIQLMFPLTRLANGIGDSGIDRVTDGRAMGTLWHRLVTGRYPVTDHGDPALRAGPTEHLKKYAVPDGTIRLIQELLSPAQDQQRPLAEVALHCRAEAAIAEVDWPVAAPRPTELAYKAWLARTPYNIFPSAGREEVAAVDLRFADSTASEADEMVLELNPQLQSFESMADRNAAAGTGRSKKRARFPVVAASLGSLFTIAALIAAVVATTRNQPLRQPKNAAIVPRPGIADDGAGNQPRDEIRGDHADHAVAASPNDMKPVAKLAATLNQVLIDDDGQALWETPTTGKKIDFSFVPDAPKIACSFRLAELLRLEEGRLLLQALGPDLNEMITAWQQRTGVPLPEIEHLLITLHTDENFLLQPFVIATLVNSVPPDELIAGWRTPTAVPSADGMVRYDSTDGYCFYFPDAEPDSNRVARFAVGPQSLIEQSIQSAGANPLAGLMGSLASWTDRDRHASILFLRAELFNQAGQELFAGPLRSFNRQLQLAMDDDIRGGLLSLHLDNGTYLEMHFDQTADMKNMELESHVRMLLQQLASDSVAYANSIRADSHWEPLRARIAAMMTGFKRSWRVGTEQKRVIANCWLPAHAAHNLAAAFEMALTLGGQSPNDSPSARKVPATLMDLLALPRDLSVTTNPDLNLLIKNLEQEIRDDQPQLPFDFEIRLRGTDLAREGITQNQRPGDFEIKQQPLSDILTGIMVRANPNRNILGPSDTECKLVWVVADDPDERSRQVILITTRAAAAENAWPLPTAFVEQ